MGRLGLRQLPEIILLFIIEMVMAREDREAPRLQGVVMLQVIDSENL